MEPIHYVRVLIRRWPVILVCIVIAAVPAWLAAPAKSGPPVRTFTAKTTLIRDAESGVTASKTSLATAALLTTTGEVPRRVASELGWTGDPAVLSSSVSTTTDTDVGSLVIEVTNPDGDRAALLANTFAETLTTYLAELAETTRQGAVDQIVTRLEELRTSIDQLDAQVTQAQASGQSDDLIRAQRDAQVRQYSVAYERLQQLAASQDYATSPSGFVTLEEATPVPIVEGGFKPPSSRPGRLATAGVIGLLVGSVIVLAREQLNPRIRSKETAETSFGLPVMAEVPKLFGAARHDLAVVARPRSHAADAFRIVRTSLQLLPAQSLLTRWAGADTEVTISNGNGHEPTQGIRNPSFVLITSATARDGKTTLTANLAAALAEAGRSVLIVDADLRRPRQHAQFGVELGRGLIEVLQADGAGLSLEDVVRSTRVSGVRLITAGQPVENPAEVIMRRRAWVAESRELADVVLVDTGPVLESNEATELIGDADAVIVAARTGATKAAAAARMSEVLARLGAPVLGVVLIGGAVGTESFFRRVAQYRRPPRGVKGPPEGRTPGPGRAPDADVAPRDDVPSAGAPGTAAVPGARVTVAARRSSAAQMRADLRVPNISDHVASTDGLTRAVAAQGLVGSSLSLPAEVCPEAEWDRLLRGCRWQRITGLLLEAIELGVLPTTEEQRLEAHDAHGEAMGSVLRLERVLVQCVEALDAKSIDHRVLKGPAASRLDYADPSLRAFGDVDLLVRSEQWDAACATLTGLGFTRLHPEPRAGFDSRFSKGTTFRTPGRWEVDLHRTFVLGSFGLTVDLQDVWRAPDTLDIAGRRVQTLGTQSRFLNACFHAALGDVPPRLVPLRDIAEMHLAGQQPLDVDAVIATARRWQAEVVVARAINLCWTTFELHDTTALSVWAENLEPDPRQQKALDVYLDRRETYVALMMANLRAVQGLRNKAGYLRALVLPDPSFVTPRHAGHMDRWRHAARVTRRWSS